MVFGFSLGGSKEKGESESKTAPWKPQATQLKYAFDEARDLYGQGAYQGPWVAPTSPYSTEGIGMGTEMARSGYNYLPGMYSAYGQELSPLLSSAANYYQRAAEGMSPYGSPEYMETLQQMAEYNPALQGQLEAAQRGIYRNLSEQTLPALRYGGAATGNTASTRRGIAEGIAARGAGEQYADVEAAMRDANMARAYQTANLSAADRAQAMRDAAEMGMTGLGYQQQGFDAGQQSAGQMAGWGDYQRGLEQEQIAGEQAEYEAPWENLMRFYSIISGQNWGSESQGETDKTGGSFGLKFGF